jgi:NAD-dependent SIR2 family protein deacetylase
VTALQQSGALAGLVTQNVDGLHQAAGARDVVELHGGLDRIRCLGCGDIESRADMGQRLRVLNPGFAEVADHLQADGDAELSDEAVARFVPPDCLRCGCDLVKPDVVFFGESVPPERVAHCFALVEQARALFVLGSSLTVFSGYRFARAAARRSIPLAIVNQGPTRADDLATVRVDAALGPLMSSLVASVAA